MRMTGCSNPRASTLCHPLTLSTLKVKCEYSGCTGNVNSGCAGTVNTGCAGSVDTGCAGNVNTGCAGNVNTQVM